MNLHEVEAVGIHLAVVLPQDTLAIRNSGNPLKKIIAHDMEWPQIHATDALRIRIPICQEVRGHTIEITDSVRISPAEVSGIVIRHPVTRGPIQLGTFHDLTTVKLNVPWDAAVPNQARMISCCKTSTNTVKYRRRNIGRTQNSIAI